MFPMVFDQRYLSTLPLPGEDRIQQVSQLIRAVIVRRVFQYFRQRRGTEAAQLNSLGESLHIIRLEDEHGHNRLVSLVSRTEPGWALQVHERLFDYLAFVVPGDPDAGIGDGTAEERKMLAFFEFLLRHEVEHMLYPDHSERGVIEADVAFALDRQSTDPTYYRALSQFLADEMNGIDGDGYLALFDAAERDRSIDEGVTTVLRQYWAALSDLPESILSEVFLRREHETEIGVLRACHGLSHAPGVSLTRALSGFAKFLLLFTRLGEREKARARTIFNALLEDPGGLSLCRDLELSPPAEVPGFSEPFFIEFSDVVRARAQEMGGRTEVRPAAVAQLAPGPPEQGLKSLKDRIEAAHVEPRFPAQVLEVIDKNRLNAVGHSGSKYSELIETLLAIPWGTIKPIRVPPEVFEDGLHRTHYGLQRPKELLCDFFTNLIWRYQLYSEEQAATWRQTGSAFLLVGPPGVGKTSLAISVAQNLGIPYHKISLGGMRDEADIRGHGFTYEGSKPGSIVQGLIKMGVLNGLFILDEADKTEKFAIATLLEILDPEQNHLFHDKYTETTVDIDLSNCHFFLTANTLETVPAVVVNRCEVVQLDRYSVEEKIAIAREHLIRRVRGKYQIDENQIAFDPNAEEDLLRYLIRSYTYEAGVRELERLIRTLFLRIQRKEVLTAGGASVQAGIVIRRETIKKYLKEPTRPRQIGEDDRVGEMIALGVDIERGVGSIIPIQATAIASERAVAQGGKGYLSIVHATGNIEKIMDESRKVATTGIYHCAGELGIDQRPMEEPVHLHFMGASTRKDGPSAGGAIAIALASLAAGRKVRRDIAMTGEIDTKGRITAVGGLAAKLEAASSAGCQTVIIPRENLWGDEGIERFPDALKAELQTLTFEEWGGVHEPFDTKRHLLQVVAVDHVVQAVRVAFIDDNELETLERVFEDHARKTVAELAWPEAPCLCLQVIQVKAVDELDGSFFEKSFWEMCPGLTLLVQPEIEAIVKTRLSGVVSSMEERVRPFDPARESLSEVTRALVAAHGATASCPIRFSLIAPYYFLKRDGITEDMFPAGPGFEGVTLFANNYSVQDLKIKGCKRILNRVFSLMARSSPQLPGSCPFLGRKEGIHVADLGFIPEAYRLDIRRAEKILSTDLERWLGIVEGDRERSSREQGGLT